MATSAVACASAKIAIACRDEFAGDKETEAKTQNGTNQLDDQRKDCFGDIGACAQTSAYCRDLPGRGYVHVRQGFFASDMALLTGHALCRQA